MLHGVDLEAGDSLSYEAEFRNGAVKGTASSLEEFGHAIDEILRVYASDRLEVALKKFGYGKLFGVCPKSFPRTALTIELTEIINLCVGGQSGVELCQLPFAGSLSEQPNLFIEGYQIFVQEHTAYMAKLRAQEDAKTRG